MRLPLTLVITAVVLSAVLLGASGELLRGPGWVSNGPGAHLGAGAHSPSTAGTSASLAILAPLPSSPPWSPRPAGLAITLEEGAPLTGSVVPTTPSTVPSAPLNVTLHPSNGAINVSWQPPLSDGGAPLKGYLVVWSPSVSGSGTHSVGVVLHAWVSGLVNGQVTTFQVAARNGAGTGPFSSPVSAAPGTLPHAPTGLRAFEGNGQVTLSWVPPTNPAGYPIQGYTVNLTVAGSSALYGTLAPPLTIGALTNGVSYRAAVQSFNALGPSSWSGGVPFTPATSPSPPPVQSATLDTQTQVVTLSWSAPTSTGGSAVVNYTILWASSNGSSGVAHVGPRSTHWSIAHAVPGSTLSFSLVAANRMGSSSPANVSLLIPSTPLESSSTPPLIVLGELTLVIIVVLGLLFMATRNPPGPSAPSRTQVSSDARAPAVAPPGYSLPPSDAMPYNRR